jgi:2-keto-4-pentenoate hydratase
VSADPRIERGMRAQLERRAALLAGGALPLGWKVGFNVPATQERLGIDGPLAGFLTSAGLLEDGGVYPLGGAPAIAEPEVAVEVGADGRSIAALLPALEVAHPPDLTQQVDDILAGNVFHRAVAFGPRVETTAPGAARILVNGEQRHVVAAEDTGERLTEMVEAIAGRVAEAGEELRPGELVITGVIAPPPPVEPGDRVRLELEALGAVELGFTE